jgi:predicted small metal-binding protein
LDTEIDLYTMAQTRNHDFINQLQGRRRPGMYHTMYGETEEELLKNAKEHGIKEHGYTEETWNEKMSKDQEKFKTLIKSS